MEILEFYTETVFDIKGGAGVRCLQTITQWQQTS